MLSKSFAWICKCIISKVITSMNFKVVHSKRWEKLAKLPSTSISFGEHAYFLVVSWQVNNYNFQGRAHFLPIAKLSIVKSKSYMMNEWITILNNQKKKKGRNKSCLPTIYFLLFLVYTLPFLKPIFLLWKNLIRKTIPTFWTLSFLVIRFINWKNFCSLLTLFFINVISITDHWGLKIYIGFPYLCTPKYIYQVL